MDPTIADTDRLKRLQELGDDDPEIQDRLGRAKARRFAVSLPELVVRLHSPELSGGQRIDVARRLWHVVSTIDGVHWRISDRGVLHLSGLCDGGWYLSPSRLPRVVVTALAAGRLCRNCRRNLAEREDAGGPLFSPSLENQIIAAWSRR